MDRDYIYAPTTVTVEFGLEAGLNIFESLALLADVDEMSGLQEWIYETARTMSPDLRARHQMVMSTLFNCIRPNVSLPDFTSYIRWIVAQNSVEFRDRALGWIGEHIEDGQPAPDINAMIADEKVYLEQLERIYIAKRAEKGHIVFDTEPYRKIHPYLSEPEALKQLIVSHLQTMWEQVLKPEWERKLPLLQASVEAYRQVEFQHLTALEAIRAVTGRDMSNVDWWKMGEHLIFVPTLHIGPYLTLFNSEDNKTSWIMFGVRLPFGTRARSTELSRSELNTRLSALADDTRLRILDLVMQEGELCAQDIITTLDLSQSAASRNLRQLTATGYLVERRRETAKCYSLNRDRVDDTLRALRRFFRAK